MNLVYYNTSHHHDVKIWVCYQFKPLEFIVFFRLQSLEVAKTQFHSPLHSILLPSNFALLLLLTACKVPISNLIFGFERSSSRSSTGYKQLALCNYELEEKFTFATAS